MTNDKQVVSEAQPAADKKVETRKRRGSRKDSADSGAEKVPYTANLIRLGPKRKAMEYVAVVKTIFANSEHEELVLLAIGKDGNMKVAQVSNLLAKWGYATIKHIGTKAEEGHGLRVVLAKAPAFMKLYQEHVEERIKRREAYQAAKAEAAAKKEAEAKADAPADAKEDAPTEAKAESAEVEVPAV